MAVNITDAVYAAATMFTFGVADYVVFVVMLLVSAGIGVYFGFFSIGGNTTDEYLLGGKRMKTLPIAISLVASQLSGLAIMAIPAEIYSFGINYVFTVISMLLVVPFLCYMIIPVFYNNDISNCYEYLQRRFNKATRQLITVTFIATVFLYLPVFIFIPSMAFSQVTSVNIHVINAIVCSICVFYTMLGGIKAVVWTDVVQGAIMVGSSILIAVMGVSRAGGMSQVIDHASEGGRLHVNLQLDLETRTTIWNCFLGGFCMWGSYVGFNQSCVQRIVALPSLAHARKSLYYFAVGFLIIVMLNCFTGVVMFAKYHDCDPVAKKVVEKAEKMMPFFVQDVVGDWKGMPGVFMSCVFSASLSTISANLNSLSGIFYFDYVKPFVKHTERKANLFMKACVLVIGVYCALGGFVVEQFTSIMQVVVTISGITHGTVFGVFTLGMLVPRVHGKVALISLVTSMITMLFIVSGAQAKMRAGELSYEPLPLWTHGCEDNINATSSSQRRDIFKAVEEAGDAEFSIFNISFYWYSILGVLLVWSMAIPLSYIIPSDQKLDPRLLSPIVRSFVKSDNAVPEELPLKDPCLKHQMQ